MPILEIRVNVDGGKSAVELKALMQQIAQDFAPLIGKPLQYVQVSLQTNQLVSFGGDGDAPCAMCSVTSIGNIDLEHNTAVSAFLSATLAKEFGVSPTRYYCRFVDVPRDHVGFSGATFANLPAAKKDE